MACNPDGPLHYAVGERPEPINYQFLDADGNPISLVGFTASATLRDPSGAPASYFAEVDVTDPANGIETFEWPADPLTEVGVYRLVLWATNGAGTQVYAGEEIIVEAHDRGGVPV